MKRTVIAALAMPLAAAIAVSGVLLGTHHASVRALEAAVEPMHSSPPAGLASCGHGALRAPFVGVAVNPMIGPHVKSFHRATGAHIQVVEVFTAFDQPFQKWEAQQITAAGALPLIQLNPRHISLAQIAAGRYDPHIREYADEVRAFGCQVMLSFGHEMNGWWYTWGRPDTTPATYIAAWRHIYDIFAAQGVTNVIWSWDPSHQHQYKGASFASDWFPGNGYVDMVGIDGYLGSGQNFADIFGAQLRNIRQVTSKPVYLAETGVAGGTGAGWQVANLFAALKSYDISGLVWFDLNRKQPWRLEGRPSALAAYRKGVASLRASQASSGRPGATG